MAKNNHQNFPKPPAAPAAPDAAAAAALEATAAEAAALEATAAEAAAAAAPAAPEAAAKIGLRAVHGTMVHPLVPMEIFTDKVTEVDEIDSWLQSQINTHKIVVV